MPSLQKWQSSSQGRLCIDLHGLQHACDGWIRGHAKNTPDVINC